MENFKDFIVKKIKKEANGSFFPLAIIFTILSVVAWYPSLSLGGIPSGTIVRQGVIGIFFAFIIGAVLTVALWYRWIKAIINPKNTGVYRLLFVETERLKRIDLKVFDSKKWYARVYFHREDMVVLELPLSTKDDLKMFSEYVKKFLPQIVMN